MSYARNLARLARAGAPIVDNLQAIRDLTIYDTLYPLGVIARGHTTPGDGGGGYFNIITGQTPGHFTDDDITTAVFTGGDGSAAAVRESPDKEFHSDWAAPPKDGVTDAWPALNAAFLAFLDQLDTGCNVFVVDACAAGYVTSKAFYAIGYGGYTIRFEASITNTATLTDLPARTMGDLFYLGGEESAELDGRNYVDAINLELGPGVVLDGGGDGITNYVYETGQDNANFAVVIQYCFSPSVIGGEITNGLVGSMRFRSCQSPVIRNCRVTRAQHDNGLQFTTDPEWYTGADPAASCNGLADNCVMEHNEDYGCGAWNCNNVTFRKCVSSNNGTETSPHGSDGGHAGGGVGCERSSTEGKTCTVRIIDCTIGPNIGKGVGCTGSVEIIDTFISGVTLGETGTDVWDGCGVAVIGGSARISGGKIENCIKHGVYALAHNTYGHIKTLIIDNGTLIQDNQRAIFVQGVEYMNVGSTVRCENHSNDPVRIDNTDSTTDYNEGNGTVYCSAIVTGQKTQRAAEAENVGMVDFSGMRIERAAAMVYNSPPLLLTSVRRCVVTNNTVTTIPGGVIPVWIAELAGSNVDSLVAWGNRGVQTGGDSVTGLVPGSRPLQAPVGFAASVSDLTDSTGGTVTGELIAISGSGDDADINRNFATLNAKLANLLGKLEEGGSLATTPWEVVDP